MRHRRRRSNRRRASRLAVGLVSFVLALGALGLAALAYAGSSPGFGLGTPRPVPGVSPRPVHPVEPANPSHEPPAAPASPRPSTPVTSPPASPPAQEPGDGTLRAGDEGPEVLALQRRLDALGYPISSLDGVFGEETLHALVAFQKVNGLARDGVAGPATTAALAKPVSARPVSAAAGFHVEIDLARQVMLLVSDGRVGEIHDVSTGSGQPYTTPGGGTAVAHTPTGTYAIERKIDGWRTSALGRLYRPAYFVGGYAIHGSLSVPPYPASHGCVRVTLPTMDVIYDRLAVGTPVIVHA